MQKSRDTVSGGTANEERVTRHTSCCCRLECNEIMNYHGICYDGEQSTSTGSLLNRATAAESKGSAQKRPATLILATRVSGHRGEMLSLKKDPHSCSFARLKKSKTDAVNKKHQAGFLPGCQSSQSV